ncbi:MAG: hypothetical protein IJI26_14800 [Clostridia bacterium]|nr:hypothetical protein [Clostridia bacterium]
MIVDLLPGNDEFSVLLEEMMNAHSFQEDAGEFSIEFVIDVEITIVKEIDVLLQHGGVLRQRSLVRIIHCIAQITVVFESNYHTVTTLFVLYEQYTT